MIPVIPEPRPIEPTKEFIVDLTATHPERRHVYIRLMNVPEPIAGAILKASTAAFLKESPNEKKAARLMIEHCWWMRREMAMLN